MPEHGYSSAFILAPPFLSHFGPLVSIGQSLSKLGTRVTVGCTEDFREDVRAAGLEFAPVQINRNKNRGVATQTTQIDEERHRLDEFLRSTERGPVETLITQARHRRADMLANPEELIKRIREIEREVHPSVWIVDQLSYGATLALHGLGLRYVTFCAPHPDSIPLPDAVHGVPPRWPAALAPSQEDLARLRDAAGAAEKSFTGRFNELLDFHFGMEPVASAFRLHSPVAVLFNYPQFRDLRLQPDTARAIFAGHTVQPQPLPHKWESIIDESALLVVLAFGTFLGSRADVLVKVIRGIRAQLPGATIAVGAGDGAEHLDGQFDSKVIVDRFIPQRALLERADLVVHHGGVSSFTESLFTSTPMIVMPFSSDQFSVASDVETWNLGSVLNPNDFDEHDLRAAVDHALGAEVRRSVDEWSRHVRARGPAWAARELEETGGGQ